MTVTLIVAGIALWCALSFVLALIVGRIIDASQRQVPTGLTSNRKINPNNKE